MLAVALLNPLPIFINRLRFAMAALPALPGVGATAATATESAVFSCDCSCPGFVERCRLGIQAATGVAVR